MIADKKKVEIQMARLRINRAALADRAELTEASVKNVLYGRNVRPATIGKLAYALGVDVTEIVKEEA